MKQENVDKSLEIEVVKKDELKRVHNDEEDNSDDESPGAVLLG